MHRIRMVLLAFCLTVAICFSACSSTIQLLPDRHSDKPLPSTVMSVKIQKNFAKDQEIAMKVGIGRTPHTQYLKDKTPKYTETVLQVRAQGVMVNGCLGIFEETFDITENQYEMIEDRFMVYQEIILDFSGCNENSGTITINLTSYFENATEGSIFYIAFQIKNNRVSLNKQ